MLREVTSGNFNITLWSSSDERFNIAEIFHWEKYYALNDPGDIMYKKTNYFPGKFQSSLYAQAAVLVDEIVEGNPVFAEFIT